MTLAQTRKSKMNYVLVKVVDDNNKSPSDPVISKSLSWKKTIDRLRRINTGRKPAGAYVRFEVCSAGA